MGLALAVVTPACGGGDDDDGADSSEQSDVSDQSDEGDGEVLFEDSFQTNEHGWLRPETAGPNETGSETVPRTPEMTVTLAGPLEFEPAFEFEDDRTYEMAAECTGGGDHEVVYERFTVIDLGP